jgi:hypothetical protein
MLHWGFMLSHDMVPDKTMWASLKLCVHVKFMFAQRAISINGLLLKRYKTLQHMSCTLIRQAMS